MSNIKCVVFDLDGTLVQSAENIYHSTITSFDDLNITYNMSLEKFKTMIGWHFEDIFSEVGVKINDFEEFIGIYKSHYFEFIDKSKLYDNVMEILQFLNEKKIKVALLTTKAQDQADLLVKHFEMDNYFNYVMGRRPGVAHKPAAEPLEIICNDLSVNVSETMMVGDSEMDIQCGHNANAVTCGVTYGYRTPELLKNENPTYIIDNLLELKSIITNNK